MKSTLAKMSSVACFRELEFWPIFGVFIHFARYRKSRWFSIKIINNLYDFIKKLILNLLINKNLIKKWLKLIKCIINVYVGYWQGMGQVRLRSCQCTVGMVQGTRMRDSANFIFYSFWELILINKKMVWLYVMLRYTSCQGHVIFMYGSCMVHA